MSRNNKEEDTPRRATGTLGDDDDDVTKNAVALNRTLACWFQTVTSSNSTMQQRGERRVCVPRVVLHSDVGMSNDPLMDKCLDNSSQVGAPFRSLDLS